MISAPADDRAALYGMDSENRSLEEKHLAANMWQTDCTPAGSVH